MEHDNPIKRNSLSFSICRLYTDRKKKTGYVDLSLLVLSSYKTTVYNTPLYRRDWLTFIWYRKWVKETVKLLCFLRWHSLVII